MHRILFFTFALTLAASGAAHAQSETVRQVLQDFGLLGTWANDCNLPPSPSNIHAVYAGLKDGKVRRTYFNAPGQVSNEYVLDRVNRISSNQIVYEQKGSAGRITVVLMKEGNRYRVFSSQNENGTKYVEEGKFTAATGDPGRESPWQTRCGDSGTGAPRPTR